MDVPKLVQKFKNLLGPDNRIRLIVAMGLAGMALILISQFVSGGGSKEETPEAGTAVFTSEQYIAQLEEKLTNLIMGMEGVGRAEVMVTLESGIETVYAQEEKRNVDKTQDPGTAEAMGRTYEKENVEQRYILVDTEYGRKEALVRTQLEPRIQGVVIVCEGAGKPKVEADLIHVVTTALHIPTTRVCVVKIGS